MALVFDKFSDRARQLIFLARLKAGQRGGKSIETEDLLAAFIIEDQGGFADAASNWGENGTWVIQHEPATRESFLAPETADALLAKLEALSPQSQPLPNSAEMPLSQASQNAITRADARHDEMQHNWIEPLHLLAAILEHQNSKAAQIFRDDGMTREKIDAFMKGDK